MNTTITRAHALIGAAALLCVLVVPLTASGSAGDSGDPQATASDISKKKFKKLKRKVKNLQQQVDDLALQEGPQGPPGEQGSQGPRGIQGAQGLPGTPGQDATNLFAYIRDNESQPAPANTASVDYGRGVTAVSDPAGDSNYTVTFNRSVANCVVLVHPGFGDPIGSASVPFGLSSIVNVADAGPEAVDVQFGSGAAPVDTAFMITAFC